MAIYIDDKLIKKLKTVKKGSNQTVKTWSRRAVITPEMIGYVFLVHNGKEFIKVGPIHEDMVGHKLGEFSPTTKFPGHGGRKAAEEEKETKEKEAAKIKLEEKQEDDKSESTT